MTQESELNRQPATMAATSKATPAHSEGVTGSWRDTLFVWSGKLVVDEREKVTWKGTWVGVDSATADAPTAEEAKSSVNSFTVLPER